MEIDQKIREKYKNKALIIPNYLKDSSYTVEDFSEIDELITYFDEVYAHEADLTQDGVSFIKESFGLENFAKVLFTKKWNDSEFKTPDQILEWLKWWESKARKYS